MLNFPQRLLSCSALTLGDPRRGQSLGYLRLIKPYVNSTRFFTHYNWPHIIEGKPHPPFNMIWGAKLKIDKAKMAQLRFLCEAHNEYYLIPIVSSPFDRCQFFNNWEASPLNKRNGGIIADGDKKGLLDFYKNHRSFAVDTIQAMVDALHGVTAVIEQQNESALGEGLKWLEIIRESIKAPPNIKFMCSHIGDYDPPVDALYDYCSHHGICNKEKIYELPINIQAVLSTDGCRNTGGDYFQRRPGTKQIEPILKQCLLHGCSFEFMCKRWDFFGRLAGQDYKILHLLRKYGIQKPEEMEEHKPEIR